jgi:hypothetical protein
MFQLLDYLQVEKNGKSHLERDGLYRQVVSSPHSTINMKELAYREMGMIYSDKLKDKKSGSKYYAAAAELDVPKNHKTKTYNL